MTRVLLLILLSNFIYKPYLPAKDLHPDDVKAMEAIASYFPEMNDDPDICSWSAVGCQSVFGPDYKRVTKIGLGNMNTKTLSVPTEYLI